MTFLRFILVVIFWSFAIPILAIDTLNIGKDFERLAIQDFGWLYSQTDVDFSINGFPIIQFDKVMDISDSQFQSIKETGTSFQVEKQIHWVKFYLKNETERNLPLIFEVQNPRTNQVQLFYKSECKINESQITGDNYPYQQRAIDHRYYLFPISIQADELIEVFVVLEKYAENNRLLMALSTEDAFHILDRKESFFLTIYLAFWGTISALMLVSTLIFRRQVVFYFFLYCASVTLMLIAWFGYGYQYFWTDFPKFNDFSFNFFTIFAAFGLLATTRIYLETGKYLPIFDQIIKSTQYGLFGFLFYLFYYKQLTESVGGWIVGFSNIYQGFLLILIFLVAIFSYQKRKNKDYLIFIGGFSFVLFGGLFYSIENLKLVNENVFSGHVGLLTFGIDLFALMFIIGRQIQQAYTEKKELQYSVNQLKLEAASALLEGQQQERQRLSLDLHDGTSLRLATLKMRLSQILPKINSQKEKAEVQELLQEIGKISHQVRNFTHALAPLDLDEQSFTEATEDLIYTIEQADSNLNIEFDFHDFEERKLTNVQAHVLFQTIQELLNNILKHAEATEVKMDLKITENDLILTVKDDGKGFDVEAKKEGIGLKNISLRATFLNGKFDMKSSGNGSQFAFYFPI